MEKSDGVRVPVEKHAGVSFAEDVVKVQHARLQAQQARVQEVCRYYACIHAMTRVYTQHNAWGYMFKRCVYTRNNVCRHYVCIHVMTRVYTQHRWMTRDKELMMKSKSFQELPETYTSTIKRKHLTRKRVLSVDPSSDSPVKRRCVIGDDTTDEED